MGFMLQKPFQNWMRALRILTKSWNCVGTVSIELIYIVYIKFTWRYSVIWQPLISISFLGCDDAFVQENESEKQLSIQACKNGCGIAAETQVHYIQITVICRWKYSDQIPVFWDFAYLHSIFLICPSITVFWRNFTVYLK